MSDFLWATFMHAKYCRQNHPCMVGVPQGSSYVWRRMIQVREVVEQHLCWLVRSGHCNFWFDNWLGSNPLCQRLESVLDHKIVDFILNGRWNQDMLWHWVLETIAVEIVRNPVPGGSGHDSALWYLTESGDFSLASTYHLSSGQRPASFMFDRVWHHWLPVKISFFMILVLRIRLPLASALGRLNVHGPSKCFCCIDSQSKALGHIFSESDLARFLWAFFGNVVGVAYRGTVVRARLVVLFLILMITKHFEMFI